VTFGQSALVECVGTAARFLGLAHGCIRLSECGRQVFGGTGIHPTDADAGTDIVFVSGQLDGAAHRLDNPLRGPGGACLQCIRAVVHSVTADFLDQQDELVTGLAGEQITRAHYGLQPLHRLTQELVAGLVPGRVVDDLEPVEVDNHYRHRWPGGFALVQFPHPLEQAVAVR
jgi:hypothetical protein